MEEPGGSIQTLAFYLDFEGVKNIYVLQVLILALNDAGGSLLGFGDRRALPSQEWDQRDSDKLCQGWVAVMVMVRWKCQTRDPLKLRLEPIKISADR